MRKFFLLLLLMFFIKVSYAQRYEIGMFLGGNNIIGDIGTEYYVNPNSFTVGGLLKWNKNESLAIRANINFSIARGDANKSYYPYNSGSFNTHGFNKGVGNGDIVVEWNVLPYDLRKRGAKTPYMYIGLGALIYQGQPGVLYSGDIGTDPHAPQLIFNIAGFETTLTIPFGVGYKYALNHNWVLATDLGFRYSYSDNLDNSAAIAVGNLNSNDWFTTLGITLTYVFGRDPCACGQ